jgi:hypothetical protein
LFGLVAKNSCPYMVLLEASGSSEQVLP